MTGNKQITLPDPFLLASGARVRTTAEWPERRQEIVDQIIGIGYGSLPPRPKETQFEELHTCTVSSLGGARIVCGRVATGPDLSVSFILNLLMPAGEGPFPVVLNGDACWRYVTDAVAAEILRRGYLLAQFNRVELAPDLNRPDRVAGLYRAYPDGVFGALAAWAWGYHRCLDVLGNLPFVQAARVAVTGHSRGGKAALLAGATDERIALTCANNSGAGGAGCFRWQGNGSETLADLIRVFPYWFGPGLKDYVDREEELPFDQHFLKSLMAPRALLTTEALGDLWANPEGTRQTHLAAREVYRFLGAEDRLGIWFREGGHAHSEADWKAFLDFADWQWKGIQPAHPFNRDPFPSLAPAFTWAAPAKHV